MLLVLDSTNDPDLNTAIGGLIVMAALSRTADLGASRSERPQEPKVRNAATCSNGRFHIQEVAAR